MFFCVEAYPRGWPEAGLPARGPGQQDPHHARQQPPLLHHQAQGVIRKNLSRNQAYVPRHRCLNVSLSPQLFMSSDQITVLFSNHLF